MKNDGAGADLRKLGVDEKVLSFTIAFLVILSCSPVIFLGINALLIFAFVGIFFLLFVKQLVEGKAFLRRTYLFVFLISFTLFLYIAIPFREADRLSPSVIWFLLFSIVIFLDKSLLIKAFSYFSDIIYFICILALAVLILNAIGVPLPNKVIPREFQGYFVSYYVSVKLSGQDYNFLGVNLYRLNGIFAEPGHFGLILNMILFAYKGVIKTTKGKVILLTAFLTLSFGTFILLFALLIKNIILEKKIYLAVLISLVALISTTFVPMEILERFIFNKADGSLEERTSNAFIHFYNSFFQQGNIILGEGRDVLERNNVRNSDYRGFVVRYGYLGVIFFVLLMASLYWKKATTVQFLGLFYFAIVFLHRSWFVDYFAFLFFLLILTYDLESPSDQLRASQASG